MNLTDAQNALLWEHLDGKTEFEHTGKEKGLYCQKCDIDLELLDEPVKCSIPDKYEGTDADIAEKIRVYVKGLGYDFYDMWNDEIKLIAGDNKFGSHMISPADKIAAFIEVVNRLSP